MKFSQLSPFFKTILHSLTHILSLCASAAVNNCSVMTSERINMNIHKSATEFKVYAKMRTEDETSVENCKQ